MKYCSISLCSNLGHNKIKNGMICFVYDTLHELTQGLMECWFLDPIPEDKWNTIDPETVNTNKEVYIQHVLNNLVPDKPLSFNRLSYNHSCCELNLYCTEDKTKIVIEEEPGRSDLTTYIILTEEEIRTFFEGN